MEIETGMALPSKRTEILYTRITERNKKFVRKLAEKQSISESALVDYIIDKFRKDHACNKKKPS